MIEVNKEGLVICIDNGVDDPVEITDGKVGNILFKLDTSGEVNRVRVEHALFPDFNITTPEDSDIHSLIKTIMTAPYQNFQRALVVTRNANSQVIRSVIADFAINRSRDYDRITSNLIMRNLFMMASVASSEMVALIEEIKTTQKPFDVLASQELVLKNTKELLTMLYVDANFEDVSDTTILNAPIHNVINTGTIELNRWALENSIVSEVLLDILFRD